MSSEEESLLLFQCVACTVLSVMAMALLFFDEGSMKRPCHHDLISCVVIKATSPHTSHRFNKKRKKLQYDHARAETCVRDDYLAAEARFDSKQFIQMFWITQDMFEIILQELARDDPFSGEAWIAQSICQ